MFKMKKQLSIKLFVVTLVMLMLPACSGNSFHLRKSIDLPISYQRIQMTNASSGLAKALRMALEESGGVVDSKAKTQIIFSNIRERKQVIAYTSQRKARIYLLSLKFEYEVKGGRKNLKTQRINLDRNFIYDANFALGKAEEEKQIRDDLYAEAARLILLRLQYAEK